MTKYTDNVNIAISVPISTPKKELDTLTPRGNVLNATHQFFAMDANCHRVWLTRDRVILDTGTNASDVIELLLAAQHQRTEAYNA